MRNLISRILLGLALPAGFTGSARAQLAPLRDFDAYVARAVQDWHVPGLAIVVVKDDSVAFMKGYGVRELGKPDPVTVHTRFGVMSTTKAYTTMLLAMLADSGRVNWDDPVTKYLPGFALSDPWVTRELTVRDLVTHRVGFSDPSYLWYAAALSFDEMLRRLRFVPPETSLRSRFAYNNVTYALAGEVAARAAGTTWQALMQGRIYQPLGMGESYPDERTMRAAGITDISAPHGLINDTIRVLPISLPLVDPIAPAGAMFASIADLSHWLRFLLDSGRVNGHRLVSARAFSQLFTAQQVVPPPEFYPTARLTHPHFQAYGMGWFLEDYRGEFVAFHTGSIDGRSAIVGLLPDRRLGVAILTNLDHSELRHALMYSVFDRYLAPATVRHDWSGEMLALYTALRDTAITRRKAQEARRISGTHPTLPLERYAGNFSDSLYGPATVRSESGKLLLQIGVLVGELEHWQYDVFRVNWRQSYVEPTYVGFLLDADGAVAELREVNGQQRFRRVRTGATP